MQVQICTSFVIVCHGNKQGSAMAGPSSSVLMPKITSYTSIINFDALKTQQFLSSLASAFARKNQQM